MDEDPLRPHWDRLGIAPTADAAEIRRAYARAVKTVDPESDPVGFQALRHSLESLMAQLLPGADDDPGRAAEADAFVRRLNAFRRAGDTVAAIALVDQLFDAQRPGAALLDAVGQLLFSRIALDRALSPALFLHLVKRFDWRDASGRAAQSDPQRHSVLLARVAAEDWHNALLTEAAGPDGVVAAAALSRTGVLSLPPGGLDRTQKEAARALMATLLELGQFLLDRFDARSLAALRQAVEGPPLLAAATAATLSAPARLDWWGTRRRLSMRSRILVAALVTAFGGAFIVSNLSTIGNRPDETPPDESARQVLDQTTATWVQLRPFNGSVLVYFSQLVTCRAALSKARYGLDTDRPDREFPLPPNEFTFPQFPTAQTAVDISAAPSLRFVSVQLVYLDGTASPVRIFRRGAGN